MKRITALTRRFAAGLGLALAAAGTAHAGDYIGTSFPADFPVVMDASLGVPVIGFGGAGPGRLTPVIFLHNNGGTPYDTGCGPGSSNIRGMAQFFADRAYRASELWALGYQGTQCDLIDKPQNLSGAAHSHGANVEDLRQFVRAVLAYTGARQIDIVAHGMGVTLAREWVRQDGTQRQVRRFVAIEGPNNGMILCSPTDVNYWRMGFSGGFTPDSPLCQELGSPDTPFLKQLNGKGNKNTIDPRSTLVIRNGDTSFMYMPTQDGGYGPVPAVDIYGNAIDFADSPRIKRANEIVLMGQGAYDYLRGTAHLGIANDEQYTWKAVFSFLTQ